MNLKAAPPERFGPFCSALYRRFTERGFAPLYRAVAAVVGLHLDGAPPAAPLPVLDLGAGTAAVARMLAAARPELAVAAVDASLPMLRQAAHRQPPPPGLWRVQAQGTSLPFPDASVGLVLASLSFHHWEEPGPILAEVHRVLVPGGSFWSFEPDPEFSMEGLQAGMRRILRFPPAWLVRRAFRRHGFTAAEYDTLVRPCVAASPFGSIQQVNPFLWLRWMVLRRAGGQDISTGAPDNDSGGAAA